MRKDVMFYLLLLIVITTVYMQSQSRLIIGPPGVGKSNLCAQGIIDVAEGKIRTEEGEKFALNLQDLPGTLRDQCVCHLSARGLENKIECDSLNQVWNVIQSPFFHEPKSTNPLQWEAEFRNACQDFLMPFFARRGEGQLEMRPLTREWCMNGARVFFSIPKAIRPTINYLTRLFDRGNSIALWMFQNCTDQLAVRAFQDLDMVSMRQPAKWLDSVQPSRRILEPLDNPALWVRDGPGDLENMFLQKRFLLEDLSKVSEETAKAHSIFRTNAIIKTCVDYFQRTHKPLPVIVVLEEAGFLKNATTPQVINALRAYRKVGIFFWVCSQSPLDF